MKTEKFVIEFEGIETPMIRPMVITKKEYTAQLAHLEKQSESTVDNEYPMEHRTYTKEFEKYTETTHYFTVGIARTILSHYQCKPGYKFNK